ncbi:hypothetical protein HMPREF0983_03298 [Erysipelotrichaceae bacterium 3_1_53]|nr:hypothetical protein HMPREF0983_03298 [Erysipelotrichaceae bacterium 3_1_53]
MLFLERRYKMSKKEINTVQIDVDISAVMKTLEEGLAVLTASIQGKTSEMLNAVFTNMKNSISKNISGVQQSITSSLKELNDSIQPAFEKGKDALQSVQEK